MATYSCPPDGLFWTSEDNTNVSNLNCFSKTSPTSKSFNESARIENIDLGYKPAKIIKPMSNGYAPFEYLSEDGFLDNDPEKFPYGKIKNAWGSTVLKRNHASGTWRTDSYVYVQTVNNELYYNGQYFFYDNVDTNYQGYQWNLLGVYDIKKGMVHANGGSFLSFFLTNDGGLYRGSLPSIYNPGRTELTQIFPERTFRDFTYSGSTLTVLME